MSEPAARIRRLLESERAAFDALAALDPGGSAAALADRLLRELRARHLDVERRVLADGGLVVAASHRFGDGPTVALVARGSSPGQVAAFAYALLAMREAWSHGEVLGGTLRLAVACGGGPLPTAAGLGADEAVVAGDPAWDLPAEPAGAMVTLAARLHERLAAPTGRPGRTPGGPSSRPA